MKIKKILLVIMIIAIIFPSIATTLSYAKDDIISKQEENEQENIQEEGEKENNQVLENNVEVENSVEDRNVIDTENKVDEDMSTNNENRESTKNENELLEHTINTEENEVEQPTIKSNEKLIPIGIEIEEGTYYIRTKLNEEQVLDVAGQSTANSANVQTWKQSEQKTKNQMFKINKTEDGYYKIEALHSGKLVDVFGAKKENCTNVQQYEYNGTDSQKWQIVDAGDGYVSFISVCNGLYLDIAGASKANGANVQVYETNGTDSQKFKLDKIENTNTGAEEIEQVDIEKGTYYIRTKLNEEQVLDVAGQSTANSANVQIWEKSEEKTKNQMFKIAKTEDGYYKIEALHSGKVLDVYGAKKENCTNVQQYQYNGSEAQKWQIVDVGNGYVSFVSVCNGLYLDIAGASKANGANVQVYETNGTDSQKFKLEKIEELVGTQTIEDGTYMIKTWSNNNIGLDIENFSRANGANVQLWTESAVLSKNQRFTITYQGDGYYEILAQHSGKSLNVAGNSMVNGANIEQYESNDSEAQRWIIKDNGDGSYSIICKLNGLYMDATDGKIQNGSNIQLYKENGSETQKFLFEKVEKATCEKTIEDGVYKISTALNANMYLDIVDGSYNNEAQLQLWSKNVLQQQKFEITYNEEGYYEIKSANSGKVLDVKGGSNINGTIVQQYEPNGTEYQKWIIQPTGNGYYYIMSRGAEAYLDVPGDKAIEGSKMQIYDGNQTSSQMFKFEETEIIATNDMYNITIALDENKVLDVDLATSNLQIWTLNEESNNQKFKLEYLEKGDYKIVCKATGQVLTVNNLNNVVQSDYNDLDSQKWKIKVAENGYYYIVSKSTELYLDVFGAGTNNGTKLQVYEKNKTNSQKFKFLKAKGKTSNFSSLDESKYPGYKQALQSLQNQHPNWIITIDYTGLDWNTVLTAEQQMAGDQPKSLTQYTNEWRDGDTQYQPGWYKASRAAIAYMMDPRNSLDDGYVFQFQDLSSSAGTYSDIAKMIKGTFLENYEKNGVTTTKSIINTILSCSSTYNISPYHLVSRMLLEQGNGSPLSDGYDYNGRKVYNLFNVQAAGSTNEEIYINGAEYAYNNHWLSPELSILGGAKTLNSGYLSKGQTTLYYQKYNVVNKPYYDNQYMQNIRAANDEGKMISDEYKESGLINGEFEFLIPVYENMPATASPRPAQ